MAATTSYDKHDSYWKLNLPYLKIAEMHDILKNRNYHVAKRLTSDLLRSALLRSEQGHMSYHKCSSDELRRLIQARKIEASPLGLKLSKSELVDILQSEDQRPKFHRFQELPPELRNRIYEYHFASFHQPICAPSQPPITKVSSLLRRETLQLFYHSCVFEVHLRLRMENETWSRFYRTPRLSLSDRDLMFLRCTEAENLSCIRRLNIVASIVSPGSTKVCLHSEQGKVASAVTTSFAPGTRDTYQARVQERTRRADVKIRQFLDEAVANRQGSRGLQFNDVLMIRTALEKALL
ncbi:hypothetical protein D0864_01720 [Hortaea werneckii]|uniref:Uncharacterized protein n=1 Tax=Hortaea werneckii TaxID=91943 RepID=A0A3M7H5J8_HORWE|nr:hypothetical protein D0862_09997 [Hortaea werneckii]RMZ08523.1 hypothetical protein D0864_01720 [Hortaea werneckii]